MKNCLLLLLLLMVLNSVRAQDSLQAQPKSIVTLSLSPLISLAPRFKAGYIHRLPGRWWAGMVVGYNAGLYNTSYGTPNYRLFEVRPEIYFDLRPERKLKHLASIELFYINHTDHFTTDKYYDKVDNVYYRYDFADYKRVKTGFNINYSLLYYITPRLVLWQKAGLGLRNRNVAYSNVTNRSQSDQWELFEFSDSDFIEKEGSYWNVNFNLELNVAYKF